MLIQKRYDNWLLTLNRTKFKVPVKMLYNCIEQSLVSSNVSCVNFIILDAMDLKQQYSLYLDSTDAACK